MRLRRLYRSGLASISFISLSPYRFPIGSCRGMLELCSASLVHSPKAAHAHSDGWTTPFPSPTSHIPPPTTHNPTPTTRAPSPVQPHCSVLNSDGRLCVCERVHLPHSNCKLQTADCTNCGAINDEWRTGRNGTHIALAAIAWM